MATLALLAALFLLVLLFYRKVSLTNLVLVDYDLLTYFYPYKEAAAAAIRDGRLPLWNPYLFTGAPFLANPQTALLYPLNLPGYALSAPQAVKYSVIFHVFLAGVFMYAFARSSLRVGWAGGLAAALPFMFGGFLTQQVGHINQLNAAVWLPLVLLLFDLAQQRRQPLFALLGGVALAAQILAGHSQETFLLLVAFGLFFLFRLAQAAKTRPAPDVALVNTAADKRQAHQAERPRPNPLPKGEGATSPAGPIPFGEENRALPFAEGAGGKGERPLSLWEKARVRVPPLLARPYDMRATAWTALVFGLVLALGLGLSMAQLLPTLELSRESIRGGGLPYKEAVSFSLPPWLLARSLLPAFQDSPFSEYIAYSGVIPLMLAAYGLAGRRSRPLAFFFLALALIALSLALGGYNPLYEPLYKLAPPLRLFRVPARWLYLCAFALSALAGMGAHRLVTEAGHRSLARSLRSLVLWTAAAFLPLAAIHWTAVQMNEGASPGVFAAWTGLIVLGATLPHLLPRLSSRGARSLLLLGLLAGELFVSGSFLGTNSITAPQAYESLRPTVAQLLQDPNFFRVLSITRTDFDPGDLPELKAIFGKSLDKEELYQFVVAMKHQEVLSPNIPMKYGVATLDGYDGGVLPLRRYVEFKELLLDGAPLREAAAARPNQADALLRDQLAGIPDTRLLGLLNVKYVITDKQADLWLDNVYYDLSAPVQVSPAESFTTSHLPSFQATAVGLVYRLEGTEAASDPLAEMVLRDRSGRALQQTIKRQGGLATPQAGSYLVRLELGEATYPQELSIRYAGTQGRFVLAGLSLIDGRTGSSETLTPDPHLRLVHSGDLKVYENLDWQPRAYVTERGIWAKDDRDGLQLLRRRSWDDLVLAGPPPPELGQPSLDANPNVGAAPSQPSPDASANVGAALSGRPARAAETARAEITEYRPEYVRIRTETSGPAYLVLTDSHYPGWRAFLDGQETPILRANHLFRAVDLPPGSHLVEFQYEPASFRWGLALSLTSLGLLVTGAAGYLWHGGRGRRDRTLTMWSL